MSVESQIVQIVLAFLVLINPLSALPLFLELTHTCSRRERRRVAQMTAASVFVTIVILRSAAICCSKCWASAPALSASAAGFWCF